MTKLFLEKLIAEKKMTKSNPLVSIIVPVYNTKKYLPTCIESIINQTYKNLEIILVDDGSTDESGKICDKYAKKDSRILVIHKKNGGQSSARNDGLKVMHGEYLAMADSDDELAPNFIETLLGLYSTKNCSLSLCGMLYCRLYAGTTEKVYDKKYHSLKENESIKAYVLHSMVLDGRMYPVVNKLFRADIIQKNNLSFEENRDFGEDTMFVMHYIDVMKGEIGISLEPLYVYNFGTENSTVNKSGIVKENWDRLYIDMKKWLGEKPNMSERFWLMMLGARWKVSYIRSKKRAEKVNS